MAYPTKRPLPTRTVDKGPDEAELWRYRVELSVGKLFFGGLTLVVALVWMFVFGVLVGREVPMVSAKDVSVRAKFLHFLGLGKQPEPVPEEVASTWDTPENMVESLKYQQSLSNKSAALAGVPTAKDAADARRPIPREDASAQSKSEERFCVLVSSLKNKEGAQKLVEQLKSKGYASRMELFEGKWNRVLVGSFDSREKATKYAADFNRKENMQASVIRE